jgi:hypothetical protein
MRRPLAALVVMAGLVSVARAAEPTPLPIAPRLVTLERSGTLSQAAADVARQTGFRVTVEPSLGPKVIAARQTKVSFWTTMELLAKQADGRIVLHDGGGRIDIAPRGNSRESSSVAGPFRTVSRQVLSRFDLDSGVTSYAVQLDAHWEPRFPVFRISSAPQITKAVDDKGTSLTASAAKAFTQPTGWLHSMEGVRLSGLTRESRSIDALAGSYTVTASEKMLAYRFDDLTAKTPTGLPGQLGVTASLRRFEKDEAVWEAEVELTYPADQPRFESFEEGAWLSQNRMQLIPPGGGKAFVPDDHQILEAGRRVVVVYRFKEDAAKGLTFPKGKGWSIVYETPAPLVEFNVPFELKDIPLP